VFKPVVIISVQRRGAIRVGACHSSPPAFCLSESVELEDHRSRLDAEELPANPVLAHCFVGFCVFVLVVFAEWRCHPEKASVTMIAPGQGK
jgi:hypothetical protein